jgi:urea transport system substrate-binding protein
MKWWLTVLLLIITLAVATIGSMAWLRRRTEPPIRVGLLHSINGVTAISEKSMIDAEILALEEINLNGGLLGRKVEWLVSDGRSDGPTFEREARRLIDVEKVGVIFGCWTSASRKSVKTVVEQRSHLLVYPMAYEGLEQSPNILYTGAAPNQQVIPAVSWCYETLKARKFFLVGSDYVWPRCVNEIVKDQLKALGANCVGESYLLFGTTEVTSAVEAIEQASPDVIISTVVGDSNEPFYLRLKSAGVLPQRIPVLSFSIAEDELRKLPVHTMVGDYAAWD